MDHLIENDKVPRDKYHLVYIILFIAGIGTLLPWNFFITAIPYFQYQLRNESNPGTDPSSLTAEQILFGNYLTLCSMLPLSVAMIVNLFIIKYSSPFVRFTVGSSLVTLLFIVTVILVYAQLSPANFLAATLVSVVFINIGTALFQGAVFGIASTLPARNMKACVEGQAIAGVLASIAQILSIASSPHPKTSAFAYFLFALLFSIIATVMTYSLKLNAHFKYYWAKEKSPEIEVNEISQNKQNNAFDEPVPHPTKNIILQSLKDVWVHGLSVLLCLMFTLALFPALVQPIRSMNYSPTDEWSSKYFTPVIVFLSYNCWDWIGRYLAGAIKWPRQDQKWVLLAICTTRVVFIPFTLFMNQQPRSHLPVVFLHDAFPIILVILLGLTNGYLLSLAMQYGPTYAKPGAAEGAGAALAIYLAIGLSCGVALSACLALAI